MDLSALDEIESQLVQALELQMNGGCTEALLASMIRGALSLIPTPQTPRHIPVLKRLCKWKADELLSEPMYEQTRSLVLAKSRPEAEGTTPSCTAKVAASASHQADALGSGAAAEAFTTSESEAAAPKAGKAGKRKRETNQRSLFDVIGAHREPSPRRKSCAGSARQPFAMKCTRRWSWTCKPSRLRRKASSTSQR